MFIASSPKMSYNSLVFNIRIGLIESAERRTKCKKTKCPVDLVTVEYPIALIFSPTIFAFIYVPLYCKTSGYSSKISFKSK